MIGRSHMIEIIKNGYEFLDYIEDKNKLKVPPKLRNMIRKELDKRHNRYIELLSLVTHVSRIDKIVFFDLLENLLESAKHRS